MSNEKLPSLGGVLLVVIFLAVGMSISVLWLNIPIHITLILATVLATFVAMKAGYTWNEVQEYLLYGCNIAMAPMLILMIIGVLIGSWIAAGTVPTLIYYGLQVLSPSIFLVTVCFVCCIASLATGSSWTTGGTLGVAFMGIGQGLGVPLPMVAGAVVSGAAFGDKMSPLSDSTNLAAAVAEADLFDHIKSMIYTTGPAILISLVLYGIVGAKFGGGNLDTSQVNATLEGLRNSFNINLLLLIPPVLVVYMAIKKVAAIPALIIASLVGGVFAMIFQGASLTDITNVMNYGFTSNTGVEAVDKLLSRGGMQSMMWTVSLGFIALSFGGILEKTRMLEVLLDKMSSLIKNTSGLIATTVLSCIGVNLFAASQYIAIVIPGRMVIPAFKEKKLLPQVLSRTLEDAGTLTSPLVPWGLCGVFFTGALGVPTIEYLPWTFLSWICPIIAIIYGFTGFAIFKEGDIPSVKTYSDDKTIAG